MGLLVFQKERWFKVSVKRFNYQLSLNSQELPTVCIADIHHEHEETVDQCHHVKG